MANFMLLSLHVLCSPDFAVILYFFLLFNNNSALSRNILVLFAHFAQQVIGEAVPNEKNVLLIYNCLTSLTGNTRNPTSQFIVYTTHFDSALNIFIIRCLRALAQYNIRSTAPT